MMHLILEVLGITDPSGGWYLFWSGFGADITEFGAIFVLYRHIKCKHCWRLGKHPLTGTHYRVCRHHLTEEN